MNIDELRELYTNGGIEFKSYLQQMFENYEELFSYQELMKNSKVKEILINEEEVLFKMKMCSPVYHEKEYEIIMEIHRTDYTAVPNTVLSTGNYEPMDLDMVSRITDYMREGIFFDVGANLGWYTLNIKKQYPHMRVYAFEPISETFNKVKKNIELNHIDGAEVYNIALYHENTTLNFFYDVCASGASSFRNLREDKGTREVLCKTERLDDFVKNHNVPAIDFIKCDVEGSELFVYQGGMESIKKYKPVIFSEMLRKWAAKFGYHPNDIIDLLVSAGYQCFVIKEQGKLKKFDRVDEETIETNYFFLHPEKHAGIIRDLCF